VSRLALAVSLLLAAGCAAPIELLGPPPGQALGPALAVAAPTVDYEPSASRPRWLVGAADVPAWQPLRCVACDERLPRRTGEALPRCAECGSDAGYQATFRKPYQPTFAAADLQQQVADALRRRGGFPEAVAIEAEPDAAARREAARAADARWLLELAVRDVRVEFRDTNGLQPLKAVIMIVSSILIFPFIDPPNWFIPSEVYEARAAVDWTLTDLADERVLSGGTVDIAAEDAFAALWPAPSRGFFIAGFLRAPGCLEEEHWADIAEHLRAPLQAAVRDGLVAEVEAAGLRAGQASCVPISRRR